MNVYICCCHCYGSQFLGVVFLRQYGGFKFQAPTSGVQTTIYYSKIQLNFYFQISVHWHVRKLSSPTFIGTLASLRLWRSIVVIKAKISVEVGSAPHRHKGTVNPLSTGHLQACGPPASSVTTLGAGTCCFLACQGQGNPCKATLCPMQMNANSLTGFMFSLLGLAIISSGSTCLLCCPPQKPEESVLRSRREIPLPLCLPYQLTCNLMIIILLSVGLLKTKYMKIRGYFLASHTPVVIFCAKQGREEEKH